MKPKRWEQIDELFHAALAMEPAVRAKFLRAACNEDPALRSEVEALLAADRSAGNFLENGVDGAKGLEPGLRLGGYQIIGLIGRGGMGEVYRAHDTRLSREVALKVLPQSRGSKGSGSLFRRFDSEALLTANVEHPAVVPIYERGELSDGRPYYSMKLISGRSLRELIDERKNLADRMALLPNVIAVAEALAHAHTRRVVHRDVKPSNIIIGEFGETVLIDWGVAKDLGESLGEHPPSHPSSASDRTEAGAIIGTPAYMSPEQALGSSVGERSDVFSLGATLYHLLAGRAPYQGDSEAILPQVERGDYPPLTEGQPEIPGELAAIVNKAMEREPARRYPTARELAEDLRRFQTGQLVLSHRYSARELLFRRMKRHQALLLVSIAFLGVAGVGTGVGLRRIFAERDRASREAETSRRVSQFMTEMFKVSDPSEARGNNVTAREILDQGSKQIESGLAKEPAVQARLMDTMAQVYESLGLFTKARPLAEKAVALRQKLLGPDHPDTLRSTNLLANLEREVGHHTTAEKIFLDVVQRRRRVLGPEHPDTLLSMNDLGVLQREVGMYSQAADTHSQVLEARRRSLGAEHADTLVSMNNLAVAYSKLGRLSDAETLHRQVLEIRRRTLGSEHLNTLRSLDVLANLQRELGHYDSAKVMHEEVLQARRGLLGPDHPQTLRTLYNLAEDQRSLGSYSQAETIYRNLIEAQRRVLGPENVDVLRPMAGLGAVYLAMKRFQDAEAIRREVLELSIRRLGPEKPNTLVAMKDLAEVESALGRQQEAEKLCRRALEAQQRAVGPDHPHTLTTLRTLANVYARQNRFDESEKLLEETLAAARRALGSRSREVGLALYSLASLELRRGNRDQAMKYLWQAVDHGLSPADIKQLQQDDEFKALWGDPQFESLVADASRRPQPL